MVKLAFYGVVSELLNNLHNAVKRLKQARLMCESEVPGFYAYSGGVELAVSFLDITSRQMRFKIYLECLRSALYGL